jgi:hypothetical protein
LVEADVALGEIYTNFQRIPLPNEPEVKSAHLTPALSPQRAERMLVQKVGGVATYETNSSDEMGCGFGRGAR